MAVRTGKMCAILPVSLHLAAPWDRSEGGDGVEPTGVKMGCVRPTLDRLEVLLDELLSEVSLGRVHVLPASNLLVVGTSSAYLCCQILSRRGDV